jgi:2-polyprenyl-3-methyl-5-hydroxy-6-metoxy-1,4-benzoquinol methylase
MNCPHCLIPLAVRVYEGRIRLGQPGKISASDHNIWTCKICGIAGLEIDSMDYSSDSYRITVDGNQGVTEFPQIHDWEQASLLRAIGTSGLAGNSVADVGCGGGRFLDLLAGFTRGPTIAIEPAASFHLELQRKGHKTFNTTEQAAAEWRHSIDLTVSFDVIEHVDDPSVFVRNLKSLSKPGGRIVVGTPNMDQLLLRLMPQEFGAFFFRQVHRWYFTQRSLQLSLESAGLKNIRVRSLQRYDFSNIACWLRDRRPTGNGAIDLPRILSANLASALESVGMGEYLIAEATA